MDILLKGYYGYGNLGDDLLMLINYQILKESFPKGDVFVFSNNSVNNLDANSAKDYNSYIYEVLDDSVRIVDWSCKKEFDLVLDGGGGVYFSKADDGLIWGWLNSLEKIFRGLSVIEFARKIKPLNITHKHRISFGIGIEKYHKRSAKYIKDLYAMRHTDHIFVRDRFSYNFLKKKRMRNRVTLTTDSVFGTKYWLNNKLINNSNLIKNVGIVCNDGQRIGVGIEALEARLLKNGYAVTFFSFHPEFDKDSMKMFGGRIHAWHPKFQSIDEYLKGLSQMDILVTGRAHGAIIGACLKIPAICINMSVKLEEVSKMLSKSSILVSMEDVEQKSFDHIENYKSNKSLLLDYLNQDVESQEKIVAQGLKVLRKEFDQIK